MIARIGPDQSATAVSNTNANVYRNNRIPSANTDAISVDTTDPNLLSTIEGRLHSGRFLNTATEHLPAVVLGADTAAALGIDHINPTTQIWLGDRWFAVVAILNPLALAPELDRSALIGFPIARRLLHVTGNPNEIYIRTNPAIDGVQSVLAATADPASPQSVTVGLRSDHEMRGARLEKRASS